MKILNFGSCNIDYVYSVEHIVRGGETIAVKNMEVFPGGKGLNQSVAIARAGEKVYHAGILGRDTNILHNVISQNRIDNSYIKKLDENPGQAIIQVDDSGENSILVYEGTNGMIGKDFVDEVLNEFSKGDILLLQNEISNVSYIVKKAYEKGMKIFFNPSPFNEKIQDIDFNCISCVILNEIEAKEITGTEDYETAVSYMINHYPNIKVMLTLGKQGCIYTDSLKSVRCQAYKVKTVDTTAAGDTFTGYFISGFAKGEKVEDAIRIASAASAIVVSKKGAASSIPNRVDVEKFLEKMGENENDG